MNRSIPPSRQVQDHPRRLPYRKHNGEGHKQKPRVCFCHLFLGYECTWRISWFLCNDSKSPEEKCHLQQECDHCPKLPHHVIFLFFQPQNLPKQELCLQSLRERHTNENEKVISNAFTVPGKEAKTYHIHIETEIKFASIISAFP